LVSIIILLQGTYCVDLQHIAASVCDATVCGNVLLNSTGSIMA
jgi:hypothetical protein